MKTWFSLRRFSQAVVLGAVLFLTASHLRFGIEKAAPIDAYCPFGGVEGFLTYMVTGQYLQRIYASSFILLVIVILLTLIFGRVFCGFFCPLGALQEWMRMLGRKMGIKKDIELPMRIDKYARYIKYAVLIAIVYFSFKFGDLAFRAYDPYNALMHLGEEFDAKIFGYSILSILLLASLFSKNWWCRYFCPLGAFLAVVKKISPFSIERDENSCIGCGSCDRACPANLNISTEKKVTSADCVSCLSCVSNCPKSSLKAKMGNKTIEKKTFGLLVVALAIVSIGIISLTSFWQTKAPSNLIKETGELNVENIRGSNTLQYVIDTTKVPLGYFVQKMGIPSDVDTALKLKDIGTRYGIKNSAGSLLEAEDFRIVIESYVEQ